MTKEEFENSNNHDHGLRPGGFHFFFFFSLEARFPAKRGEKGKQRSSFLKGLVGGEAGSRETLAQCLHPSIPPTAAPDRHRAASTEELSQQGATKERQGLPSKT